MQNTIAAARSREADLPGMPLATAQESLFFLEQMHPGTAVYNMPEGWRFRGPLDVDALHRAVEALVQRHETLRTVFLARDGQARQVVLPAVPAPIEKIDLREHADAEAIALDMLRREACRPFDLRRGPLLRILLLRTGEQEHFLLLNMHHLISDAWSFGILMKEMAELYGAFKRGLPSPLRELPVQYIDFVAWQKECLATGIFQEQLEYWKSRLTGELPPLELPLDRPRQVPGSFRGATRFFSFAKSLASDLKALSTKSGATLFMTVLAGFAALLHRYTSQQDILIGSPLSGRDRTEIERLIGFFINTQPLRINLEGDPSFLELLRRVRETTLGAYANQGVPLEHVIRTLQPQRKSAQTGLFDVVFALQTAFTEQWEMPGLSAERIELETGTAKFDWTLLLTETSRDLSLRFEYKPDLFDTATIERVAGHFQRVLEASAAAPGTAISKLALLSPAERQQLLVDWNNTDRAYERDQCVHQVFEARAREHADCVALVSDAGEVTYGELNRRANALARRLQARGVGPRTPVGVCLERSPELVIALLAILKAGGCYVPLDCSYPRDRLEFMARDSGIKLLVTQNKPAGLDLEVIHPEVAGDELPGNEPVCSAADAEHPAYLIYTSGSTGVPKATVIPHRAVVRLVRNTNYIEITPEDRLLQLAPVSFDASTFEIWGALLNGAKLVIAPPETPSLEVLGRMIEEDAITVLWLTAGLFHRMVDSQLDRMRGLRCLLAGGDALSVAHVVKARQALDGCALINGYGPTENTTFSCCYTVPPGWSGGNSVPIGKPISNSRAYVLDPNLEPVPIGVPGELYLGGDGLALGYLNRPELDAEKFVLSPFHDFQRERLYRTGDRARWLPDGRLEFLGRLDAQVKIRGFRVEPGEVEAAMSKFPGIREVAVVPFTPQNGSRTLAAYVVPQAGAEVSNEALRTFLQSRLPSYLVPSHFVQLETLPLTPNGKLDRRALPLPDPSSHQPAAGTAPRTVIEQTLASIWSELLGVARVGIHDNFFQLGGHSLLAIQLISRVAKACQAEIPVRTIFEQPTIAELASAVARAQNQPAGSNRAIPRRKAATSAGSLLAKLDELSASELEQTLGDPLFNPSKT